MIWQNPWAWIGVASVAIPVLIHLLGRRSARTQRFPTLRFLETSPLVATRRTRLTDVPLMMVRIGILLAAVVALASPLLLTANRARQLGAAVARAVILDTSASMGRETATGERVADIARREATRIAGEARTSVVLETRDPASAIAGGRLWLESQPGRRELVIVSDFQAGTVDFLDFAAVPNAIGIELLRAGSAAASEPVELVTRSGGQVIVARMPPPSPAVDVTVPNPAGNLPPPTPAGDPPPPTPAGDITVPPSPSAAGASTPTVPTMPSVFEWTVRSSPTSPTTPPTPTALTPPPAAQPFTVLAGADERIRAEAAARAASAMTPNPEAAHTDREVGIVHRGFDARDQLARNAQHPGIPWQGDILVSLRRDAALLAASADADVLTDTTTPLTVITRTRNGQPVVVAGTDRVENRDRLLLFVLADAGSLASATLAAAVMRASAADLHAAELSSSHIPEATLASWRRTAASAASTQGTDDPGASDGRWLWVLALLLLGIETWMRRAQRTTQPVEVTRARAA